MNKLKVLLDSINEVKDDLNKTDLEKLECLKTKLKAKFIDDEIITWVSKNTGLNELIKALETESQFQICFLIDISRSGKRYNKISTEFVALLTQAVLETGLPKTYFSYAYIGYRERDEEYDFKQMTNDNESITKALRKAKNAGGDDEAEDVEFGLKMVCEKVDWERGGIRILIHIADAPCHGSSYHDKNISDNHPDWSDKIPYYLSKIVKGLNVFYWFIKLTDKTTLMIEEFNKILHSFQNKNLPNDANLAKNAYSINVIDLRNVREDVKHIILRCLQDSWLSSLHKNNNF